MSVQVEKLEKNMAKLTVEVPAEDVEKAIQGAYQKTKKSSAIMPAAVPPMSSVRKLLSVLG